MGSEEVKALLDMQRKFMSEILEQQREWLQKNVSKTVDSSVPTFKAFDLRVDNWQTYLVQLDQHFEGCRITEDNQKRACFLSWCKGDIIELLNKLFDGSEITTKSYEELTKKLTEYFIADTHVMAARCEFGRTVMKENQTYAEWVAELRGAARDCLFFCENEECKHSYADWMIRDMVVKYSPDERVRNACLGNKNPTLKEVLDITASFEATRKASIAVDGSSTINETHFVDYGNGSRYGPSTSRGRSPHPKYSSSRVNMPNPVRSCPGCNVHHDRNKCRYLTAYCRSCGKCGHIKSVCMSTFRSRARSKSKNRQERQQPQGRTRERVQAVGEHLVNDVNSIEEFTNVNNGVLAVNAINSQSQSHNISFRKGNKYIISLEVNGRLMEFQLDSGATSAMVGLDGYRILGEPPVQETNRMLVAYPNSKLEIKGVVDVMVKWKDQNWKLPLIVVDHENGRNLLGVNWFDKLGFDVAEKVYEVNATCSLNLLSEAKSLCDKYKCVFSNELGKCTSFKAHLQLKENFRPKFCKWRPLPFAQYTQVKAEIDRLVEAGILKSVDFSEWATPLVVIYKPNGKVRICGDFKVTINPQLEIDRYPIPRIEELFQRLQGGQKFSKIDLSDAYLQVELDEESQKLMVVNTPFGLFQYQRLPFGIASAPGIFQRLMEQIVAGIPYCVNYLDDLIVTGRDDKQHMETLNELLKRLERSGLHCNWEKCKFAADQIEYVGHIIDAEGIRPADTGLKAIQHFKTPTNLKEVEAFLGKINYYHKFIDNVPTLAEPLNLLKRKEVKFIWTELQQTAFEKLKQALINNARLVHFREDYPIILATDASSYGIGAVISHRFPDGVERPIAFASKTLDAHQKRYSQVEKEALSIIFGVRKFNQYLYGRKFELFTDHQPLVALFNPSKKLPVMTIQRLQRWAITLMGYQYEIKYKPTSKHGNADALSRLPMGPDLEFDKESEDVCLEVNQSYADVIQSHPVDAKLIAKATTQSHTLLKVMDYIATGWPEKLNKNDQELLPYFRRRFSLTTFENVTILQTEYMRMVIPSELQDTVIKMLHVGHWGISRMKQMARRYCWWPQIDADIEKAVKNCEACQAEAANPRREYSSWPEPSQPWERLHVDFAGPFFNSYWFICMDSYSKFPYVREMSKITASNTIKALQSIFAIEGLPKCIVSDNGTQFSSEEFQSFCKMNGVQHITTAPFHPESNGEAERTVRTFKNAMKKISRRESKEQSLLIFLSTYRAAPDPVTGRSPSELLHGRQNRVPLALLLPEKPVQRNLEGQQAVVKTKFVKTQQVLVRDYRRGRKWTSGSILKTIGRKMYLVDTEAGIWRRHQNQIRARLDSAVPDRSSNDSKQASRPTISKSNRFENFIEPELPWVIKTKSPPNSGTTNDIAPEVEFPATATDSLRDVSVQEGPVAGEVGVKKQTTTDSSRDASTEGDVPVQGSSSAGYRQPISPREMPSDHDQQPMPYDSPVIRRSTRKKTKTVHFAPNVVQSNPQN